jgi:hypothetical protein
MRLDRVARELEVGVGVGVLARHGRAPAAAGGTSATSRGEGQAPVEQVALDDAVEQLLTRQRRQHLALDRLAADDHVQRRLHAQHARQALRAAGTGDQAELHLGQRDRCAPGAATR